MPAFLKVKNINYEKTSVTMVLITAVVGVITAVVGVISAVVCVLATVPLLQSSKKYLVFCRKQTSVSALRVNWNKTDTLIHLFLHFLNNNNLL